MSSRGGGFVLAFHAPLHGRTVLAQAAKRRVTSKRRSGLRWERVGPDQRAGGRRTVEASRSTRPEVGDRSASAAFTHRPNTPKSVSPRLSVAISQPRVEGYELCAPVPLRAVTKATENESGVGGWREAGGRAARTGQRTPKLSSARHPCGRDGRGSSVAELRREKRRTPALTNIRSSNIKPRDAHLTQRRAYRLSAGRVARGTPHGRRRRARCPRRRLRSWGPTRPRRESFPTDRRQPCGHRATDHRTRPCR